MALLLGPGSLLDDLLRTDASGWRRVEALGLPALGSAAPITRGIADAFVALVLDLCAENAEIGAGGQRPIRPLPTRTKQGPRLFPPEQATTWKVWIGFGSARPSAPPDALSRKTDPTSPGHGLGRARTSGVCTGTPTGRQGARRTAGALARAGGGEAHRRRGHAGGGAAGGVSGGGQWACIRVRHSPSRPGCSLCTWRARPCHRMAMMVGDAMVSGTPAACKTTRHRNEWTPLV